MIISLLTKPFSLVSRAVKDLERRFNYAKYKLQGNEYKAWTCTFTIGGHQDIIESFLLGSKSYPEVEIRANPSRKDAAGTVLYVAANWRTLRDAIELKRAGKADKLVTGPVGESVTDFDNIILDKAIDAVVVPCRWYAEQRRHEATTLGVKLDNIKVWPVGVDHEKWTPRDEKSGVRPRKALVYLKGKGVAMREQAEDALRKAGMEYKEIYCGSHVQQEYKEMLEWCDFMVYLAHSETQGLALAQAWSMNRQTLVYEPDSLTALGLEAAPYLTDMTGRRWRDTSELSEILADMPVTSPRQWVLSNMTNEIAFGNFLDIVKGIK